MFIELFFMPRLNMTLISIPDLSLPKIAGLLCINGNVKGGELNLCSSTVINQCGNMLGSSNSLFSIKNCYPVCLCKSVLKYMLCVWNCGMCCSLVCIMQRDVVLFSFL